MNRLIAAIGLAAPPLLIILLLVDAGSVGSTIYGRVAPGLVAIGAASVVSWFAGMLWVVRQQAAAREIPALVRAAERLADGALDAAIPDASYPVPRRLATALDQMASTISASQEAATVDRLTEVASRTALLGALVSEVERAGRYERPLSVAFVDIDHFKSVNDTYGHAAGDAILRGVAQTLKGNLRATDRIGRYGGEEFMLLLPETTPENAAVLGEKLRGLVARQKYAVDGRHLSVTVSIGIAGGTSRSLRVDALTRNADAAMYTAKALGRNQTYIFSEPDEDARVVRAPVSATSRAEATAIGLAARDAAAAVLGSVIARMPGHRGGPSAVVASIVTEMAQHLDLPEQEIDRIRMAALLRDIGKVAVPGEVLDKSTELTPEEWQSIVQHPQLGQVILERAASLRDAVPIIMHHHEHFSGHGYPHGLRGSEIPLGARIVAIADAYDAMVQDRPYRAGIGHEAAVKELRRNAGGQFDPALVQLFCQLFAEVPPVADPSVAALVAPAPRENGAPEAPTPRSSDHPAEDSFAPGVLARRPAV